MRRLKQRGDFIGTTERIFRTVNQLERGTGDQSGHGHLAMWEIYSSASVSEMAERKRNNQKFGFR